MGNDEGEIRLLPWAHSRYRPSFRILALARALTLALPREFKQIKSKSKVKSKHSEPAPIT